MRVCGCTRRSHRQTQEKQSIARISLRIRCPTDLHRKSAAWRNLRIRCPTDLHSDQVHAVTNFNSDNRAITKFVHHNAHPVDAVLDRHALFFVCASLLQVRRYDEPCVPRPVTRILAFCTSRMRSRLPCLHLFLRLLNFETLRAARALCLLV